ncbi:MAG: hypothetical protein JWP91_756 [Fibrobacteres bacterium]|nr:hypothetical protein [Fibrobacterota bacterium]
MEVPEFRMQDHDLEARLARLERAQALALEEALERLSGAPGKGEREGLPLFLLPLAESGLTATQMVRLAGKVPDGFPLDHREIYFDFRLARWMRHIEPPTISQCLDEYMENAESPAAGMAYLKAQWLGFLRRYGAG